MVRGGRAGREQPGYASALTRAEGIVARQHQGRVAARGASARRRELRRLLYSQLVHYLVAVGSVAAKDQADLAAGESQKDLLVQSGMAPALLEDLASMVADFEAASEAARTARRDHIGARTDLGVITTDVMEQVNVLNGITRYRFGNDPEVMAEWTAARQILGQQRNGATPPAPQPGDVPRAA